MVRAPTDPPKVVSQRQNPAVISCAKLNDTFLADIWEFYPERQRLRCE